MATNAKAAALWELQEIPGVGPSIAADLYALGVRSVDDLVGRDPDAMYEKSCKLQGVRIDRCLLYVYRCAVHYATHRPTDPEAKKWWNWKDGGKFDRGRA